ncbi:hypothetical protein BO86DRAFT_395697 [Aspergillus japonicus CBS 114.51]|uniref:Integral membrane protein n=2 Tax=Aspergillus TaxID=5052 RepID=A0A2V5H2A0_ASPV1|nr:hypothetical protein BO86DRAFT_395697 [Aspergillus japonicus CBS 114.51]PYI15794.1 hypothetical protein BO99DRAFT_238188 [Aspergillus violaceofuscus CBS 115571]RAH86257.1 hypothetical protein BO86DRAFT_395697 [Aspergillus japonicus CBS 114.51]
MAPWPQAWTASHAAAPLRSFPLIAYLSLFTLLASTVAHAQTVAILPSAASSSFPSCGLTCSVLLQAQSDCLPPAAPQTDSATYASCFCHSHNLTELHTSSNAVCDDTCTNASDRSLIQTWYNNYCAVGASLADADTTNKEEEKWQAHSAQSVTKIRAYRRTAASNAWWSTHYKWVIMVIILVVGFSIISVVGVWAKRRHDRKYPGLYHAAATGGTDSALLAARQQEIGPAPGPDTRAPGQFMPAQYDPAQNPGSIASSSHTNVAAAAAAAAANAPGPRPARTSSRLQKTQPVSDSDTEIREVAR